MTNEEQRVWNVGIVLGLAFGFLVGAIAMAYALTFLPMVLK